jgi:hypothetical protein
MNQRILYFIAAVLCVTAAAISTGSDGISVKTGSVL